MREYLLVHLSADAQIIRWGDVRDGRLSGAETSGTPAQLAAQAVGRQVVAVVPSQEVLLTQVNVPTQKRQKLLQAVPFVLEEQLAEDIEQLHFAVGPRGEDGAYPVAVTARAQMDRWLDVFRTHGMTLAEMVPEVLCVPFAAGAWSIAIDEQRWLVRSARYAGFTAEAPHQSLLLAGALQEAGETAVDRAQIFRCAETAAMPTLPEGMSGEDVACRNGLLGLFARGMHNGEYVDLLQGDYSRRAQLGQLWRPWRATAALLLAALCVQAVAGGLEYRQLKHENRQLSQRLEAVFKQAFPEVQRVVNPRAQMQQQLADLQRQRGGGTQGFLGLLETSGEVLQRSAGVEVSALSYRDGRLDLDVRAGDLQVLDKLKQELSGGGNLEVEIQLASAGADQRVEGRLRLQERGT